MDRRDNCAMRSALRHVQTRFLIRTIALVLFFISTERSESQQNSLHQDVLPIPGGTVTGHVICDDTHLPARFAEVILFGIPTQAVPPAQPNENTDSAQLKPQINAARIAMNPEPTQTDFDGFYLMNNVAPGDYYVFASHPGYVGPRGTVRSAIETGADIHKPLPGIPTVHVSSGRIAQADVSMDRGAAISGKILWGDGSPVPNTLVSTILANRPEKLLPGEFAGLPRGSEQSLMTSDDLGHFRITGLLPGEYLVMAELVTSARSTILAGGTRVDMQGLDTPLAIFAPSAFRQMDANPVKLTASQDRSDIEITMKFDGLHSITGRLLSSQDHHGINSAVAKIEDVQDKTFTRRVSIDDGGRFAIQHVPSGTYTLTVFEAADTLPSKDPDAFTDEKTVVRRYQDRILNVVVGDSDVDVQSIELVPSKMSPKESVSETQ
jgi:hypothetical protein